MMPQVPLKILIVAFEFPPIIGGGGVYISNLARALSREGCQIRLITSGIEDQNEIVSASLEIKRYSLFQQLYLGKGDLIEGVKILQKEIKEFSPGILHSNHSLETLIVQVANRDYAVQHFVTHHKTPAADRLIPVGVDAKWSLYDFVNQDDRVTFIEPSFAFRDCLLKHGVSSDKISVVYPGVDQNVFSRTVDPLRRKDLVQKLGLEPDTNLIFVPSKFRKRKGLERLSEIFSHKKFQQKKMKILISGIPTSKEDDTLFQTLQRKLQESLIDHKGYEFSFEDMPVLFNLARCVVFPSESEGLGLSLLEAMASGCPIVARNVMGVEEIIQDGFNGYLIKDPENYGDWSERILSMIESSDGRNELINNGFLTIEQKFNQRSQVKRHMEIYKNEIEANVLSSGGVLFRRSLEGEGWDFYVAKHPDYGYVLPKGRKEPGETWIETSVREVREETGYEVLNPDFFAKEIFYSFEKNGVKKNKGVRFYGYQIDSEQIQHDLRLDVGEKTGKGNWVSAKEVVLMMAHPTEKEVLETAIKFLETQNDKSR
jgi:1,2-diacylglycerol 3-alpha-glucosyltransferase